MSLDLHRLAGDLTAHTGERPTVPTLLDIAHRLDANGTYHLRDLDGGRVILAREHYEIAPDDARTTTRPARRIPEGVIPALFFCALWMYLAGLFMAGGMWLGGVFSGAIGLGFAAHLVSIVRAGGGE